MFDAHNNRCYKGSVYITTGLRVTASASPTNIQHGQLSALQASTSSDWRRFENTITYQWSSSPAGGFGLDADLTRQSLLVQPTVSTVYTVTVTHHPSGFTASDSVTVISTPPSGDINNDSSVNLTDFTLMCNYWSAFDCSNENNWCEGADINRDSRVDYLDLSHLTADWLWTAP
jgi:hypothetical protein